MALPTPPPGSPPITDVGDEVANWLARELATLILRIQAYLPRPASAPAPGAPREAATSFEVPLAPPIPQTPPATPYTVPPGQGKIDEVVSSPEVFRPPLAARTSPFPLQVYRTDRLTILEPDQSVLGSPWQVPADGLVVISGVLDPSSAPAVVQYTLDGGEHWVECNGGQPVFPGNAFQFAPQVTRGDQFDVSLATSATLQRLSVTFGEELAIVPPQGFAGAVPEAIPGKAPYPTLFVPVSSFPQLVGKVAAGTTAVAGQPLVGPFTVPAPGTIGVFGFIASGQATLAVAIESVNGVAQYGSLNGGAAMVPGAWTAATIQVDQGDTVTLSVTAACTVGTVRVTYTPST